MNERYVRFDASGTELAGVLSLPEGTPRGAVLIVHPFGEEKKFAHRALTATAWALAEAGFASLRFDLTGCGDSFGEFREASITRWTLDVKTAAALLAREAGCSEISLLGLRLGATLCWLARPEIGAIRAIVLWEPILAGKQYMETLWRKKLIKEMMTSGRGRTSFEGARAEIARAGFIDLDGWDLGGKMIDELVAIDIGKPAPPCPASVLAVQIAFNGKVSRELDSFAQALRAGGASVEVKGVRERTIWDRIDIVPATELIESTVKWLTEHAGAGALNHAS